MQRAEHLLRRLLLGRPLLAVCDRDSLTCLCYFSGFGVSLSALPFATSRDGCGSPAGSSCGDGGDFVKVIEPTHAHRTGVCAL